MACFVKTLTRESVKDIEIGNPFLRMKIFSLTGVESKPLTLSDVPQSFRPYPGCIFVSGHLWLWALMRSPCRTC